ncbi:carbohydrate-binding module family 21 protein [Piedraia hortae CBS 480.64]|uniref:Carbohydrate-binding module family 21 protein n=1 Tax=Piedraia hortae CBS 480.64 TaxID=1314780 RepID=A0A6A7BWJ0_9PEZI|nr:carbohydrate-binding module family 21 protein [Piedraia hortae CBS 480.64]
MPYTPALSKLPKSSRAAGHSKAQNDQQAMKESGIDRQRSKSLSYLQKPRRAPSIFDSTIPQPSFDPKVYKWNKKVQDSLSQDDDDSDQEKQASSERSEAGENKSGSSPTQDIGKSTRSRPSTEPIIGKWGLAFPVFPPNSSDEDSDGTHAPLPLRGRKDFETPAKSAMQPRRCFSTPQKTTRSKSVHFCDGDNETKHFRKMDTPTSISTGSSSSAVGSDNTRRASAGNIGSTRRGSAGEIESARRGSADRRGSDANFKYSIEAENFSGARADHKDWAVNLIGLKMASDQETIIGTVAVQNWSYFKEVFGCFTFDDWQTMLQVSAEYHLRPHDPADARDHFIFKILLNNHANLDQKIMQLCVRYKVNDGEHWDNNEGNNYRVKIFQATEEERSPSPEPLPCLPQSNKEIRSSPSPTPGRPMMDHAEYQEIVRRYCAPSAASQPERQ